MTFEVELKARLRQPEEVEKQAAGLGMFIEEVYKEDVYFRRRGETALIPADRYRLRHEGTKAVVTFKQMVTAGNVEVNDEVEFEVSDAYAFFRFVDRFGFEPFVVKRKKSRVYRVGRATIELSEVEHLGHFAELEILCNQEVDVPAARAELTSLLAALGLTESDLEPRRYIAMIQQVHPVQYRFINDPTLNWPFEEVA